MSIAQLEVRERRRIIKSVDCKPRTQKTFMQRLLESCDRSVSFTHKGSVDEGAVFISKHRADQQLLVTAALMHTTDADVFIVRPNFGLGFYNFFGVTFKPDSIIAIEEQHSGGTHLMIEFKPNKKADSDPFVICPGAADVEIMFEIRNFMHSTHTARYAQDELNLNFGEQRYLSIKAGFGTMLSLFVLERAGSIEMMSLVNP
ncbi:MAG: hypothetical protein AABX38_04805 [Candidatus Micrarchaeota archaeon]